MIPMKYAIVLAALFITLPVRADVPFALNESLARSKRVLLSYIHAHHPETVYCQAKYSSKDELILPEGLDASVIAYRSERVEVEHMVPAENFGRNITAWKSGHPECKNPDGIGYNGRPCAEKVSRIFRIMQADLYNLYPSIGSVNAARQNFSFGVLPDSTPSLFRSCSFKVEDNTVEPPEQARGVIARTYLYFENEYAPLFQMTPEMKILMTQWNETHPVTSWECQRAYKIEKIQKNQNKYVKTPCLEAGLWKE